MMTSETLNTLLDGVGTILLERGQPIEVVAIGGGGLLLLGIITRPTRDLDLVAVIEANGQLRRADPMPRALRDAIDEIATLHGLDGDWMNAAPSSLVDLGLPAGFMTRTIQRVHGGLTLHLASRQDQIAFKLYAAVDQGPKSKHVDDLQRLEPNDEELLNSARWTVTHDVLPEFRAQLVQALNHFGVSDDESF